jgi:hypothetical protein
MFSCRILVSAVTALSLSSTLGLGQGSPVKPQTSASAVTAFPALRLAQVPPGQVVAMYLDGSLAVAAQGVPLVDVLQAVCGKLGAEVDVPAEAKVLVRGIFGPGPPQEVLASLLKESPYVFGTAGDSTSIVRVVVLSKSKDFRGPQSNPDKLRSEAEPVTQPQAEVIQVEEKANAQEILDLLSQARTNFVGNEADGDTENAAGLKTQADGIFKALAALIQSGTAAEGNGSDAVTPEAQVGAGASASRNRMHRPRWR